VLGLQRGGEGTRTLDLPGGVIVAGRDEEVAFYRRDRPAAGFGCREIPVGGTVEFGGWRISSREARFDAVDAARAEVAYLDGGRGPYAVRMAGEGDVIRPLGLGGTKKVSRAMMDRKVPSDLRRGIPVVVGAGGEVAWIAGGELGEGFKVGETTKKILRLEVERF
jgi:tRNA(Ile)-lysidine synthase